MLLFFFFAFLYSHAFFWTLKIELIGLFSFYLFLFFGLFFGKTTKNPINGIHQIFMKNIYTTQTQQQCFMPFLSNYLMKRWQHGPCNTVFFCRCCLICLFRKKFFTFSLFLRNFTLNVTILECVDAMLQYNDLNSVIYTFDFRCCSWFFHQWNLTGFPMSNQTNFMFFFPLNNWLDSILNFPRVFCKNKPNVSLSMYAFYGIIIFNQFFHLNVPIPSFQVVLSRFFIFWMKYYVFFSWEAYVDK